MNQIYVVGIGPGAPDQMTIEAARVLQNSQVIIGYTTYIDLLRDRYPDKEFLSTPMRQELDRCRLAFDKAMEGLKVAMVCSGDAGVYGMSGLLLEMAWEYPQVEVCRIGGLTAAIAGAAVLGAPLMHDFSVISLSDLMTPWEKIAKRLRLAAEADLVLCLYNPASRKRADYLQKACDIVLEVHDGSLCCGLVENIGREGEKSRLLTLQELREAEVNMFTTVFIGNSQTKFIGGKLVTPRGYQLL